MISLYFNCFLTENTTDQLSYGHRGWFYPVTYPRPLNVESISQIDILIKVIKSYSTIEFDVVVCLLDNDFNKQGKRLYGTNMMVESPKVLADVNNPIVILKAGVYNQEVSNDIVNNVNSNTIFWE